MPQQYRLIIGIANYQHINPLPSNVIDDATAVHESLASPASASYYNKENPVLLLDQQATLVGIREALQNIVLNAQPIDTVLIYFTGHGGNINNEQVQASFLLPIDCQYDNDEALSNTALSSHEFTETLNAIKAKRVVVIFDCCHSAGIGQPKQAKGSVLKTGLSDNYLAKLAQGSGRVIMASSRQNEYSYLLRGDSNSLFTKHLLKALSGEAAADDGYIRIFQLFEYIYPRVRKEHPKQTPVFKAELEDNFPLFYTGKSSRVANTNHDINKTKPLINDNYKYDVYISYAEGSADEEWVATTLYPYLEKAGLRVADSNDVVVFGASRVANLERGFQTARRMIVVLSDDYLKDNALKFENMMAQDKGISQGLWRVIPIYYRKIDKSQLPLRLSMLKGLDVTLPHKTESRLRRLSDGLKQPLTYM